MCRDVVSDFSILGDNNDMVIKSYKYIDIRYIATLVIYKCSRKIGAVDSLYLVKKLSNHQSS